MEKTGPRRVGGGMSVKVVSELPEPAKPAFPVGAVFREVLENVVCLSNV